jgi:hypothetical protein
VLMHLELSFCSMLEFLVFTCHEDSRLERFPE